MSITVILGGKRAKRSDNNSFMFAVRETIDIQDKFLSAGLTDRMGVSIAYDAKSVNELVRGYSMVKKLSSEGMPTYIIKISKESLLTAGCGLIEPFDGIYHIYNERGIPRESVVTVMKI